MKKNLLAAILIMTSICSYSQVGIGTTNPAASAQLEVSSTSKGFLPPRLTYQQQESITNPSTGLVLWCTNCGPNGELQVYNGTSWTNVSGTAAATPNLAIGTYYRGGQVVYVLQAGDPGYDANVKHGLIAATSNFSTAPWGCVNAYVTGATANAIGSGNQNTLAILAGYNEAGIAARWCADLVLNGYSDWYLPSIDELEKLYLNRGIIGNTGVQDYWSSSTNQYYDAFAYSFNSGYSFSAAASSRHNIAKRVCAFRSF